MTWTKRALRREIGQKLINDTLVSTASATAGTQVLLVDTKMAQTNDTFNNAELYIVDGSAAGDFRYVTDWVQSTGTYTADRNFTATVVSGVAYEVHRTFSAQAKNNAINRAIRDAGWRWPRRLESEVLEMETTTYVYRLVNTTNTNAITSSSPTNSGTLTVGNTAGFPASGWLKIDDEYIAYSAVASATTFTLAASGARGANGSTATSHGAGVEVGVCPGLDRLAARDRGITELLYNTGATGTGYPWAPFDRKAWKVRDNNNILNLQLLQEPPIPDNRMRLVYEGLPPELSADTDTLDPDDNNFAGFVTARAAAILCTQRAIMEREEPRGTWTLWAMQFQALANSLLPEGPPPKKQKHMQTPTWDPIDEEVEEEVMVVGQPPVKEKKR